MKSNPKHIRAMKDDKAPLEYLVSSADAGEARVLRGGAIKYGVRNWLIDMILASTYVGAIKRHINAWESGSNVDPDSGEHPLSHVRACCAVVMDAEKNNQLVDDRDRKESIDQDEGKQSILVKPDFTWTVTYSTTRNNQQRIPITRTKTFGPFTTFDAAREYARTNPRGTLGYVSISHVIAI